MIPYAKFRARLAGEPLDLGVAPSIGRLIARNASRARRSRDGRGRCGEDVPAGVLERVERGEAAAREQADSPPDPAADPTAGGARPAASSPRARSASKRSSRVSGSFGASSTVTS